MREYPRSTILTPMLYVAYFSWEGPDPEYKAEMRPHGTFSCLVEADSVDEAGEKLWYFVASLKPWFSGFEGVRVVHFDSMIEVEKLPEQPVVARYEEPGGDRGQVWITLPGVSSEFCRTYDHLDKDNDEVNEEGELIVLPFASFVEGTPNPDPGSFRFS